MDKNFNRIIAYGCSYTAGDEIMDHIVMGVSFEECNQTKLDYLNNRRSSIVPVYTSRFKEDFNIKWNDPLHRNSSWAAQLAKLLDIPFENRAMNGSGLDEQYLGIYMDYAQGQILDNDLVLVGLTSMNRTIDFRLKEKITTLVSKNIPDELGSKLFLDIYNDDFLVFQYFKTLNLLSNLSSDINLLIQPMVADMTPKQLDNLKLTHSRLFANNVWKNIIDNIILPEECLQPPIVNGVAKKCAFGHPPLESHIELAEKLHKKFIDKLLK
jgi:hypothetical protein